MLGLSVVMAACMLIACTPNSNPVETVQPFEISVTEVKVISNQQQMIQDNNLTQSDQIKNRLVVSVSINNVTDMEFKKVWYELQLNSEVKPYIASQIIEFTSDKMNITTHEKSLASSLNDKTAVWGFSHDWNMSLTSEDDLNSYHGLSPEELAEELKSITVQVNWSGGKQTETIPLELSENDVNLLK